MFDNYAATASRHPSSLPLSDDDIFGPAWTVPRSSSPCESLTRQMSITQLSQQFSQLRHGVQPLFHSEAQRLSLPNDDLGASFSPAEYVGTMPSSRRRLQRQHGVRLLCDSNHLRSIQEMVSKMVQSGDQCAVSSPTRTLSDEGLPSHSDDEGYSSLEENRRNGSISSISSSDSIRLFRRSAEPASGAKNGRVKKARSPRGISKQR